ncbi:bifunctional isocitrate dehydrogenase kinase/phosphatase [Aliiglaciecola sp. CAU 1673]|uniref:bifunctional isocitrate dehydrogenase kinase/phosphatase n=1 Tax=Aliiglaciecola sp. CAU 1673 TaxID=3032595 RepID=UPI0023DAF302|nr:bifunctional isocitrate dehydrogenase kinase/phosphatase [Aliiglaciecola sp. CAU 1673]MDF2179516.1 bifunctional isocitrate dehydrogenase kinase/phosphatase [Aliiglaciecola sp. CAU 1673]
MSATSPKQIAYEILKGFEKSFRWYSRITKEAQQRFEQARWKEVQGAVRERIAIYDKSLTEVVADIYQYVHPHQQSRDFWCELKLHYLKQLDNHPQFELAETFFNSVIGRLFKHQKIDDEIMFVLPSRCYLAGQFRDKVVNDFDATGSIRSLLLAIMQHYRFQLDFEDRERDLAWTERYLRESFTQAQLAAIHKVEILQPVFYRNKAAYLVGRMCAGNEQIPFVMALMLNSQGNMYVDTLLTDRNHLSALFGFARSYFMADTQYPAEVVAFLQQLLPNKKHFELYISLGYYKHGKTVFYRNFLQHLSQSQDQFEAAPGIRGLVMAVFHLPSYGVVFKLIKDEFAESKKITRQHVIDCYRLVKMHDRVGRMADTHEYMNFRLPLHRISAELLEELQTVAASNLEIAGDELIIKHLYIERKMTPLNIYLDQEQDAEKVQSAIDDLGRCIKHIAAANIFPGDMLHKNFGITRHGRVIYYDYDEICYMNQRNFRALPHNDDPYALDTLSVAPDDVFPEQFEYFILSKPPHKALLKALHPELLQPEYWQQLQKEAATGQIKDIHPYPDKQRFIRRFGGDTLTD